MSKAPVDIIKYVIHAEAEATGLVEKPDLIGAIFGQTEGLLGEDLDLRELQKSGRIGRIDAEIETKGGITKAKVTIPSSLDMVETSIIAAGIETITRVGPCDAKFRIGVVEDVRDVKRKAVVDRAREILQKFMSSELPDSKEISEELRQDIRGGEITRIRGLDAGPGVEGDDNIIIVEGRADVINLLRNGIKNSIAVGGIKIPPEITEIVAGKVVTAFVDGDRGGDLILKSLRNAGVKIDSVARAPVGREVEGLARKEVIMSLRRKRPAEEALADLDNGVITRDEKPEGTPPEGGAPATADSTPRPSGGDRRDDRGGRDRGGRDRGGRDRGGRDRGGRDGDRRGGRRDDRGSSGGRDRMGGRDRPRGDRPPREPREDSGPRERPVIRFDEPVKSGEESMLLEKLSGIKNQALLLNDKFEEMKKVDLASLKKEKDLKKATALVIDDIVTKEILELADKCKYIVGITTAGNLAVPEGKIVVTKF